MDKRIVELPEIEIIGKLGLCTREHHVVQELWKQANEHFFEVAELGMKEKDGSYVGFWGAMSDETMSFQPWTDRFSRGYYLAGVEVNHESVIPKGWTKWVMPARKYLMVEVTPNQYQEIFEQVITQEIPVMGFKLGGAVCDYTKPATGQNYLLFPIL